MSIEFVDPEPVAAPVAAPAPVGSAWPGRVFGVAAAVAGALAVVGVQVALYAVVRTASIVDFDGTTQIVSRIPVDAFGAATPVLLDRAEGVALSDVTVTVSSPDGIAYGPWWTGLGILLVLLGVWALVRPRSTRPAAVVAAVGGVLLGSLGAAWLAARAVSRTSVPQIRFDAAPGAGLWLLLAAGALAVLAGLLRALTPRLPHRPRRIRRHDVHDPGPVTP